MATVFHMKKESQQVPQVEVGVKRGGYYASILDLISIQIVDHKEIAIICSDK